MCSEAAAGPPYLQLGGFQLNHHFSGFLEGQEAELKVSLGSVPFTGY